MKNLSRFILLFLAVIVPFNQTYALDRSLQYSAIQVLNTIEHIDENDAVLTAADKELKGELTALKKKRKKVSHLVQRFKKSEQKIRKGVRKDLDKLSDYQIREQYTAYLEATSDEAQVSAAHTPLEEIKLTLEEAFMNKARAQYETISEDIVEAGGYIKYIKEQKKLLKKIVKNDSQENTRKIASLDSDGIVTVFVAAILFVLFIVLISLGVFIFNLLGATLIVAGLLTYYVITQL